MHYKSAQPILSEHLLCAGGSDHEFTDIHVILDGPLDTWPKAVLHDKHPPEGGTIHAWPWGCMM